MSFICRLKTAVFNAFSDKIDELLVCGTDTEACVFATAVDAFDAGYKIKVLKDLCGSHNGRKFHELGCAIIQKSIEKPGAKP